MVKVSVVMPTYNTGKYIADSVESVLKQAYRDVELIVIDGGSTDGTDKIMERYISDGRVSYMKKPGYGISAARNAGIKIATGELIAFLDSDDIYLEGMIGTQVDHFRNHKNYDICYTNSIYFNDKKDILSTHYNFSGDLFYFLKRSNFIHPSAVTMRRRLSDNYLYDEKIPSHEDWDFFLRLARDGYIFHYIREPYVKIRVRPKSTTTNVSGMNDTRCIVGNKARGYWREFKARMDPGSWDGWKSIFRYLKFKLAALVAGFPKRPCYNRPTPNEILWMD